MNGYNSVILCKPALHSGKGLREAQEEGRLHGARRARGTSLCPGHILLFGHVNILFLSLLSKSLPIKGREAANAEGRAWTMFKTVRNKLRAPTPLYVTHHAHDTPERGHRPSLAL